jgi:hypothetical protein
MTASREHKLVGLESDSLLAFLSLVGMLRALETVRSEWRPRVRWDVANPPTRPILILTEQQSPTSVAEAVAAGCDILARDHQFNGSKGLNWPRNEARRYLQEAVETGPTGRRRADIMSALASDAAIKDDETVMPTPLCLMFGQGHQHFLDRLAAVPNQASAPPRGRGRESVAPNPADTIAFALFQPWERTDATPSFRWDPAEDRRYALRFTDPSKDTALTVHGANRLAAIGFPAFTVVPATTRGRVRLAAVSVRYNADRNAQVTWPIWIRASSLNGIRAMLTHPIIYEEQPDRERLRSLGIYDLRRATRISAGKFLNFTRAALVAVT